MPNHVTNKLVIKGEEKRIEEVLNFLDGGNDKDGNNIAIDFNNITPMPKLVAYRTSKINNIIHFETAWRNAKELIKKLSMIFKEVTFDYSWFDEDLGKNLGRSEIKDYQIIKEYEFDNNLDKLDLMNYILKEKGEKIYICEECKSFMYDYFDGDGLCEDCYDYREVKCKKLDNDKDLNSNLAEMLNALENKYFNDFGLDISTSIIWIIPVKYRPSLLSLTSKNGYPSMSYIDNSKEYLLFGYPVKWTIEGNLIELVIRGDYI